MLRRPRVPTRRHYRPQGPRTGVPRRRHCRLKCPTRLPTDWHRQGFDHLSGAVRAGSAVFRRRAKRTGGEKPRVRIHVVLSRPGVPTRGHHRPSAEAWRSRARTLQTQIPTRLNILPPNTSQTKWCCSGSPHHIFRRGPLRRLS